MLDRNLKKTLIAIMAISTIVRLFIAAILLSAVPEIDNQATKISIWVLGMGVVVYVIHRLYKFVKFIRLSGI